MRNKYWLIFTAVILTVSVTAADETVHLSGLSVFKKLTRGKVMFPHELHYGSGIDCLRCHHRYEKGINILTHEELLPGSPAVSCAACHKTERDIERAYHRMCITCHHEMNKKKTRTGPVMCGLCHIKKEK